jgi:hypothetical protein
VLVKYRRHSQQHSKINAELDRRDQRKFRRRYFRALFPEATVEDNAALDHIFEREPFSSLVQLELAGKWLARLSQTPDNFLRRQMASRWRVVCQRSAQLGLACYRVYAQIAPQFEVAPSERKRQALWLVCALRLTPDSRWYAALASVKRRMTQPQRAEHKLGKTAWFDSED